MDIEALKEGIGKIKEPRRTRYGNIRHKLEDILIIGLCSTLCGGEDFAEMEEFGNDVCYFPHATFLPAPSTLAMSASICSCRRSTRQST